MAQQDKNGDNGFVRNTLRAIFRFSEKLRAEERSFTVVKQSVFLYVAGKPDCTTADVMKATGLSKSVASRLMGELSDGTSRGGEKLPGLGWLTYYYGSDGRTRYYNLSPTGQAVVQSLADDI